MSKPIKRLEIIKNAIELEDDEIIASQISHLKGDIDDPAIDAIIQALEARRYGEAMNAIVSWLQSQRSMTQWQDPRMKPGAISSKKRKNAANIMKIWRRRIVRNSNDCGARRVSFVTRIWSTMR